MSGRPDESVPFFAEGLEYWRLKGIRREEAYALANLGDAYFAMGDYTRSAEYFEQAVTIHEELRETASGSIRREYLQNQIAVYRSLARAYLAVGKIWMSLYALELSKAKYLREQMGRDLAETTFDYQAFIDFQNELDSSTALLSVAWLDSASYQVILLNKEDVASRAVLLDFNFIDELYSRYARHIIRLTQDPEGDHLEGLITYYRALLAKPVLSRSDREATDEIGRYLYTITIGPMEERLRGVDSLVIVPDGLLGIVPFETFRNADGQYLIERFDISYAHSLVVALKTIRRDPPSARRPLLAFGGALYEAPTESDSGRQGSEIARVGDLEGIRQEVISLVEAGTSTRSAYSRMGMGKWLNLPGSLEEVSMLGKIVAGAEIYTGSNVNEAFVKELSTAGALAQFRIIHFATHGVVVPEVPELSAVVLSQFGEDAGEDGYLTMSEISGLDLAADFVNLSARSTGLGKVYRGEGVVGLTQAFLIAGTNALSVSLWNVGDESTRTFMTGLYLLSG